MGRSGRGGRGFGRGGRGKGGQSKKSGDPNSKKKDATDKKYIFTLIKRQWMCVCQPMRQP